MRGSAIRPDRIRRPAAPALAVGWRPMIRTERSAWGYGLATITDDGHGPRHLVPRPALGAARPADPYAAPAELGALAGTDDPRRGVRARGRARRRSTSTPPRPTPPTPTCACTCSRTGWSQPNTHQPRRHLRRARQRGVDQLRPVRRRRLRAHPAAAAAQRGPVAGVRRRQVPADDRLRRALPGCGSPTPTGCGSARTWPRGTTVMHEGFVNFNAGTLGTSMVEGRIVQGVVVGDGSDIGGGASIMGTLSGGGTERVSIGERCLLGANAGIGISLGDDCVVEAGLYVTAGTKVTLRGRPGRQGPRAVRGLGGCCSAATRVTGRSRRAPRTGARASSSTPRCTPTPETAAGPDAPHPAAGDPRRARGRGHSRRVSLLLAVASSAARWASRAWSPTSASPTCPATALGTSESFTPEQTGNAATISAVAVKRGPAGPGRDDRHRDRDAGVQAAQPHATATATPSGCSSSAPARAGAPRRRSPTPSTPRTRSTTPWSRSRATRPWRSPRSPRRCSAAPSPRPTPTTSRRAGCWPRR